MRFAYIDSQGNEIAVSSVDALGLRIELGAIGPETPLYDARADRWGPAKTHEVFHTLARLVKPGGELPTVLLPDFEEPGAFPGPDAEAGRRRGPEVFFDLGAGVGAGEGRGPRPSEGGEHAGPSGEVDLDFTLTDVLPSAPEPPASGEEGTELPASASEDAGDGAGSAKEAVPAGIAPGNELDLEPPLAEMDFSETQAAPLEGLELERPMAEARTGMIPAGEAPTKAEPPGTDVASEAPPRPVRRSVPGRQPRSRPSPPRRIRRRPSPGMVIGSWTVMAVVGYLGWQALRSAWGAPEAGPAATRPPVTLPDLPSEMLPLLQELGETALSATAAEFRGLQAEIGLPTEPREDWLAGVYMANASRFPDVEDYWRVMGTWVQRVRETEGRVFHTQYAAALAGRGVDAGDAELLQARADSGFLATSPGREEVYRQMDELVTSALELHGFLVDNESRIAYEPARGGVSSDPVLEAVPADTELGESMWDMVDRITDALDALGTLDRVTTARLTGVLLDRIVAVGIH